MSGRPDGKAAPIVLDPNAPMVDPLPQALILTAIVIGFGVIACLVLLLYWLFLDQKNHQRGGVVRGNKSERRRPKGATPDLTARYANG